MRKRLICLFLSLTLLLSTAPQVFAADAARFTDVKGHWAQAQITWSVVQGYFSGTSDTAFSPNSPMTRGMFVTVLGRFAGINAADYKNWYLGKLFSDVSSNSYYAPYINWAVRTGITNGTSDGVFSPDQPVTRQQMAVFFQRYASNCGFGLSGLSSANTAFADQGSVAVYAREAVETMRVTGILTGRSSAKGMIFDPDAGATRAECAVVLERLSRSLCGISGSWVLPSGISVSPESESLWPGQTLRLSSSVYPTNASNPTVIWVSEDPKVASVTLSGTVTAVGPGTTKIYAYTCNGNGASCTITVSNPPTLSTSSMSNNDKMVMIFGQTVDDPRRFYQSAQEAASHMVTIAIRVWDFADSTHTTKVTKTQYLQVHENIAETVKAIFEEIYNGDEQFPIKDVGGYRWEPGSEHMPGLAIDINYNENYECTNEGVATCGSYWKPGEDPYSIPKGGDVETAFKKYGFGWGADWRSKKDYMHFSFFRT